MLIINLIFLNEANNLFRLWYFKTGTFQFFWIIFTAYSKRYIFICNWDILIILWIFKHFFFHLVLFLYLVIRKWIIVMILFNFIYFFKYLIINFFLIKFIFNFFIYFFRLNLFFIRIFATIANLVNWYLPKCAKFWDILWLFITLIIFLV